MAKGLFIAVTFACSIFNKMILSGGSTILAHGIIEERTGIQVLWSQWFIAFLPITLLTIFACWFLILWLYPAETSLSSELQADTPPEALEVTDTWSRDERVALTWLLIALALWATDFLHHIGPAIIALGVGLILVLPKIGVLDTKAVKSVNLLLIIFVGGALSMGNVLVETQALNVLTDRLVQWAPTLMSNGLSAALTVYWGGFLYHFLFASDYAYVSTGLPILLDLGQAHGYNLVALGMLWSFAGTGRLFIYQNSILILGYSYGYFTARDILVVGGIMTLIEGVFLMALVPIYWPMVGLHWTTNPPSEIQAAPPSASEPQVRISAADPTLNGQPEQPPAVAPVPAAHIMASSTEQHQAPDPATEAWFVVRDSNDYLDFVAFLETFPHSRFNFAARMRLKQFASQSPPIPTVAVVNGWSPSGNGRTPSLTPQVQAHPHTASLQESASFSPMMQYTQRQLQTMGINPGPIDGFYGPRTAAALRLFQSQHELPSTGVLDAATHQALWAPASD